MERLPIRVRVTLAFAGVMAVVLTAAGLFVYLRLAHELDETINQGLRARVASAEPGRATLVEDDGVLDLDAASLLTPGELAQARRGTAIVDRDDIPGTDDPFRLLATTRAGALVVVGSAIDDRSDALRNLVAVSGDRWAADAAAGVAGRLRGGRRRAPPGRADAPPRRGDPGRRAGRAPAGAARARRARRGSGTTLNEMLARLEEA